MQKQPVRFVHIYSLRRACFLSSFLSSLVLPALPRSGESLDEGGHCVVVVAIALLLLSVPVHGGIQHERGAASANNG